MFKKILPQIVASLFLVGFAVFAWTEPPSAPPGGNVPAPINVGPDAQTKAGDLTVNGIVKTLKDLFVGSATIKGDGSVSTGLYAENSQKLGGHSANDVSNSGKVTGTITVGGSIWGGVCGGWGCNYCACYENTTCNVQGKGSCDGTIQHWGIPNAPLNFTTYQPVCDPGETLTLVSTQGVNQSCYAPFSCQTKTYQCVKPSINFPGCGNGAVEAGEVCDDGNQLNNVGNCNANCSKLNYFYQPLINGNKLKDDVGTSAERYCIEKGFSGLQKYNTIFVSGYGGCNPAWPPSYPQCPKKSYWSGSSWQTVADPTFIVTEEIWCWSL